MVIENSLNKLLIKVSLILIILSCNQLAWPDGVTASPIKKMTSIKVNKVTRLIPPAGFKVPINTRSMPHVNQNCGASFNLEPYTQEMNFISKYEGSDSSRSQLNEESSNIYLKQIEPIRLFESKVVWSINEYIKKGNSHTLYCTINLLYNWSINNALLTYDRNKTGAAVRKWTLGSIASAYMRLKFSESQPLKSYQDKIDKIENWFLKLANRIINEDAEANRYGRVNNHTVWAANAVMVVGVILDNRNLYNHSIKTYQSLVNTVDENGMLPSELVRESRALVYHAFTLLPLFTMAAMMAENNYHFSSKEIASMELLANIVFSDLYLGTNKIEGKVGHSQLLDGNSESNRIAWLPSYCYIQTCSEAMLQKLGDNSVLKTTRLGGPVLSFYPK